MKNKKGWIVVMMLMLSVFGIAGCGGNESGYEQISQQEAKALMDGTKGYMLIDARTEAEFAQGHIAGAVMIPEYQIADSAELLPEDKEMLILVYCRSGRRSKIAAQALVEMGYTNVKEFGGIIDWPYDIEK